MDTIQLISEISILKKKMDKAEAFLEELVEYLLVTCKDDDYITPEVICRKLAKYGYIELEDGYWVNPLADRKTEPNSSEKPNNSTISKMEQVDKDINVRSKNEPQLTPNYCGTCKHREVPCGDLPCDVCHGYSNYEPKGEPQDECAKEYEELGLKELKELIEADRKTEPTISKMEQVDKDINVRSKDEPQTDCAWR